MAREHYIAGPKLLPEQLAALDRLLSSGLIARAPRLREFLAYVSECMLAGREDEVSEQQIGCRVFGRPEGYNHTEDNIVRVTARNLRTKLEEYHQAEGSGEAWIVEIPKGGYLPAFRTREAVEPALTSPPALKPGTRRLAAREIVAWCLCAALALGLLASQWFRPANIPSAQGGLIPALFPAPTERVTVVVVDSTLQIYRHMANRTVPLDAYAGGSYLQPGSWPADVPLSEAFGRLLRNGNNLETSFSSVVIASRLLQLMPPGQVEIRHPTQMNSRDFQSNHAILLGGPWINPWGQLFEDKLNFRIVTGARASGSMVKNCSPRVGEPDTYSTSREGSVEINYARIAMLPNLGGSGKVLLLGATSGAAIEAAGDFLLRQEHSETLRRLLQVKPADRVPDFELVLEVTSVDVTPQGMRVIAHRRLDTSRR